MLENEYEHVLEQMFQLKMHGKLSYFEMDCLSAEDRKWLMNRLKRYQEEQEKASQNNNQSMPSIPRPSMPSIPRPSLPSR